MVILEDALSEIDPETSRAAKLIRLEQFAIDARERQTIAGDFAKSALNSLVLVNGGAVVALFSLIGQGAGSTFVKAMDMSAIIVAFICFALGLALAAGTQILAYVSQDLTSRYDQDISMRVLEELIGAELRQIDDGERLWANRLNASALVLAALSLVLFLGGATAATYSAVMAT